MTNSRVRRALAGSLLLAIAPSAVLLAGTPSAAAAGSSARAAASTRFATLASVSVAPHSTTAFAFGTHGSSTSSTPYALKRKGSHWSTLKVQNPSGSFLRGIAAGSSSKAWVVGGSFSGVERPLVETLKGSRFTRTKTNLGSGDLNAVAASSAKNAWAVGQTGSGTALVGHWNGKKWATVRVPATLSQLSAVSTTSPKNVWALTTVNGAPASVHWNGRKWSVAPIAATGTNVTGIATTSAKNAWAVGYVFVPHGASGREEAITFHWTGRKWKKVSAPQPAKQTFLYSVTALGKRAFAVGTTAGGNGLDTRPVVLKLTHGKWKLQSVVKRGQASSLVSVSMSSKATTAAGTWAVHPLCTSNATPPKPFIVSPHGSRWGQVAAPEATPAAMFRC